MKYYLHSIESYVYSTRTVFFRQVEGHVDGAADYMVLAGKTRLVMYLLAFISVMLLEHQTGLLSSPQCSFSPSVLGVVACAIHFLHNK